MNAPARDWTRTPARRVAAWALAGLACAALALAIRAADSVSPLLIPHRSDAPPALDASPQGATASQIDLNTATEAELDLLPGIGPALATRIADDRRANGPFKSVDDLARVPGIGARTVSRLRSFVLVSQPPPSQAAP